MAAACFSLLFYGNIRLSATSRAPSSSSSSSSASCITADYSTGSNDSKGRVSIFWDLDNKPPKFAPYHAALHLRRAAAQFGDVVDMVAYANCHAFQHVPRWVQEERGPSNPNQSLTSPSHTIGAPHDANLNHPVYFCALCGLTCATNFQLKKHRRLSHRRERKNKAFKVHPLGGYSLDLELRRAGFCVRTVDHRPQAADRALKRQMKHSMDNGVQCICLVSDDSDFSEILKTARSKQLLTIVIGDTTSLQQFADVWCPWDDVAGGKDIADVCVRGCGGSGIFTEDEPSENAIALANSHHKHRMFYDFLSYFSVEEEEDVDVLSQEEPLLTQGDGCNQGVWVFEGD